MPFDPDSYNGDDTKPEFGEDETGTESLIIIVKTFPRSQILKEKTRGYSKVEIRQRRCQSSGTLPFFSTEASKERKQFENSSMVRWQYAFVCRGLFVRGTDS